MGKLEVLKRRLAEYHSQAKELVNNACHEALLAVGYTTDDSNFLKPQTKSNYKGRMPYLEQVKKRKFCIRLSW
jgi:hypothetical protein